MTVQECIQQYKQRTGSRLTKMWLCPSIVRNPKIGRDYTIEVSIDSKIGEKLLNAEVTKHWIEPKECLCMCYKLPDEQYDSKPISQP